MARAIFSERPCLLDCVMPGSLPCYTRRYLPFAWWLSYTVVVRDGNILRHWEQTSAAMDARLFLQFLALIYICQIRNVIQDDKILRNLTVREVMEDMETLVQIKYSHRYGQLLTETNPIQRKIMAAFGVKLQT